MKKKLLSVFCAALILMLALLPAGVVFADNTTGRLENGGYEGRYIIDTAGLLSAEDQERLDALFAEKSAVWGVDIVFYTTDWFSDVASDACSYLGTVCQERALGYGDERYVCMFAVSINNRYAMAYEWSEDIQTYHRYLQVELDDIFDSVKSDLTVAADQWQLPGGQEGARASFTKAAETFLDRAITHSDMDDAPYEAFCYSSNYEQYDLDGHRIIPLKSGSSEIEMDSTGTYPMGVFDETGHLSVQEKEDLYQIYQDLYALTGTRFAFVAANKDLPSSENAETDYPYLNEYFQDDGPRVLLGISDLTNTASVQIAHVDLSDDQLHGYLTRMISRINTENVFEAAFKTALDISEYIDPTLDAEELEKSLRVHEVSYETAKPPIQTGVNTSNGSSNGSYIGKYVCDQVGLLSSEDQVRLEQLLKEKSEEIGVHLVFYSESWFSDYADSACDHLGQVCRERGYGYGDERYVCMIGISIDNRYALVYEWSADIEKYHRYLQVELDDIFDSTKSSLSSAANAWENASFAQSYLTTAHNGFASVAEKFVEGAVKHADIDDAPYEAFQYSDNYERYDLDGHRKILWGKMLLFALIGAGAGGIVTGFSATKHKPKTVTDPETYNNRKEFQILESSDQFRVRTTTRVRISSERSGGGGGHSHGGGGGGGGHGSGGHF